MVKTSRDSFIKVQEAESDLNAISSLGESGLSAEQITSAIQKMGGLLAQLLRLMRWLLEEESLLNYRI